MLGLIRDLIQDRFNMVAPDTIWPTNVVAFSWEDPMTAWDAQFLAETGKSVMETLIQEEVRRLRQSGEAKHLHYMGELYRLAYENVMGPEWCAAHLPDDD